MIFYFDQLFIHVLPHLTEESRRRTRAVRARRIARLSDSGRGWVVIATATRR